jgi:hypothetical protein
MERTGQIHKRTISTGCSDWRNGQKHLLVLAPLRGKRMVMKNKAAISCGDLHVRIALNGLFRIDTKRIASEIMPAC